MPHPPRARAFLLGPVLLLTGLSACAGHAERTRGARSALDAGHPKAALAMLNEELEVQRAEDLPSEIAGDQILLVLDRAVVLQQLGRFELSSRDLQTADKQIEVLDFSGSSLDDIGRYMFSDDSGPYRAPAYEKLLINTLNMMNYLARGDLGGARVEARRFATMQKFIADSGDHAASLSGPGSYLAGFIFEKSGRSGEALRYYDEALGQGTYASLADPVRRLGAKDSYSSPRLRSLLEQHPASAPAEGSADGEMGEILVIVNYGRVPAKVAKRVPIGLALTIAATHMSPAQHNKANYLAAQGLVTWVNYPALGKPRGEYDVPEFYLGGRQLPLEGMLAVDLQARQAWKQTEGAVVASAITRMITRIVTGETARRASGGGTLGALISLGTQATMTATDTPDTRSWAALPARIAFGRVRVPPGIHQITLRAGGFQKTQRVKVTPRSWAVIPLTSLR
ncbi:MAG: hypothetical protein OEZ06_02590 [Myxococcales bacterium]|nr:hypothetical protein [Myxococcales bacterium]